MGNRYEGKRFLPAEGMLSDVEILVDGRPLRHIVRHSPTGMNFGYSGSGPADLALSILTDVVGGRVELADLYYFEFKVDFIAGFGDSWSITREEIDTWLRDISGCSIDDLIKKFDDLDEEQRLTARYTRRIP
jgi:hypothetical protein